MYSPSLSKAQAFNKTRNPCLIVFARFPMGFGLEQNSRGRGTRWHQNEESQSPAGLEIGQ